MRDLTPEQQAAVAGPVTEPQYLVYIELDQPYYLSTRSEVDFGGNTYIPGRLQLNKVAQESCDLLVDNTEYLFTQGAQNGEYLRNPVEVYWAYGPRRGVRYVKPGYWKAGYTVESDETVPGAQLIFRGVVNSTPSISEWLSVQCARTPPRLYPFRKMLPPHANFLPSAGYVLPFDGNVIRIEV